MRGQAPLATPEGWTVERTDGWGPFRTRVIWRLPDGSTATWTSRLARKRGAIHVRGPEAESATPRSAEPLARRLRALNSIAAVAFTIGGSLFAVGAAVAQLGSGSDLTPACIYFAGGLFFNTGGYTTLLQAINSPRGVAVDGSPVYERWRWWSYEPDRIEWVSALALFAGTIVFGINLLDSFLQGLTAQQENRLIWAPDMIGCSLFLISGHLALKEICHGRFHVMRDELGWWVALLNQVGSYLFLVSALAAFVRPETSNEVNSWIANVGTFLGALCFAIGGVMQAFEQPSAEALPTASRLSADAGTLVACGPSEGSSDSCATEMTATAGLVAESREHGEPEHDYRRADDLAPPEALIGSPSRPVPVPRARAPFCWRAAARAKGCRD